MPHSTRWQVAAVAVAVLAASAVVSPLTGTPRADAAAAPPPSLIEREVFAEDGTISREVVPAQVDAPVTAATRRAADAAAVTPIFQSGPPEQRLDIVFVGDGYTADQQGAFLDHVKLQWAEMLKVEPYPTYKNSINVWAVEVVSQESGVDEDPKGTQRDTALDMGYWCGGTERALCVNVGKAKEFARQAPGSDQAIALANSAKYGGVGYVQDDMATSAGNNAQSGQIVVHEFGHTIADMYDEYFYEQRTYTGGEPVTGNLSTYDEAAMKANGRKWAKYLGQETPDGGVIGAYEGGFASYSKGIYRPSDNSLMRALNRKFSLVGLEEMANAIKAKAPGVPPTKPEFWNR
ncbi:hypothetical protein GCM10010124_15200 [Pilimelia terevasa]|uniref:IgA peptidase M64 n=1 Tax=Pilimelia terevasa TaxID=53372 RepID=A0A8J3FG92_9ACTN|nr:M64 family metallopeptidase [Pilimelia terevasa]GGK23707.1 hypothetical protein GCM10010124_15200 [Pilimelia terevasa]